MSSPISTATNIAYTDQSTNPVFKISVRDLDNPLEQKKKSTKHPKDVSLKNKGNKFKVGDYVIATKSDKTYKGIITRVTDNTVIIMLHKTEKTVEVSIENCKKDTPPNPVEEPRQDGSDYVPESKIFMTFKEFCLQRLKD